MVMSLAVKWKEGRRQSSSAFNVVIQYCPSFFVCDEHTGIWESKSDTKTAQEKKSLETMSCSCSGRRKGDSAMYISSQLESKTLKPASLLLFER